MDTITICMRARPFYGRQGETIHVDVVDELEAFTWARRFDAIYFYMEVVV